MGLAVLLLMPLYPSQSQDAFACQCNPELPLTRLEKNDAVFAGKVTDLVYLGHKGYVTIEVDEIWKGVSERSVTILDDTEGGCSVNFRTGENYLVYASRTSGIFGEPVLGTYLCQGTRNLNHTFVFDDPEVLGAGYEPTTDAGALSRSSFYLASFLASPVTVVAAIASAAGAAGFFFLRRRKART